MLMLVAKACPTLFGNPMGCSPPGSLDLWDFSGKNTGVGCHFLLQGIFLAQGLNHVSCGSSIGKWILYHWATWESHFTIYQYYFQMKREIMSVSKDTEFSFNSPKLMWFSNNIPINCNGCLQLKCKSVLKKKFRSQFSVVFCWNTINRKFPFIGFSSSWLFYL